MSLAVWESTPVDMSFDVVASNADVVHTYDRLLGHEARAQRESERLSQKRFSMSLFLIYFATRKKYPNLAHHNILFCNRYRDLLVDIFDKGELSEDFSLYLHVPTATDPSLAPPGWEAFYVLSPVPHMGKAPLDWEAEKQRYADRILQYLELQCIPDLRANLTTCRLFTPVDFATELTLPLKRLSVWNTLSGLRSRSQNGRVMRIWRI